jgi:hypothetical protein
MWLSSVLSLQLYHTTSTHCSYTKYCTYLSVCVWELIPSRCPELYSCYRCQVKLFFKCWPLCPFHSCCYNAYASQTSARCQTLQTHYGNIFKCVEKMCLDMSSLWQIHSDKRWIRLFAAHRLPPLQALSCRSAPHSWSMQSIWVSVTHISHACPPRGLWECVSSIVPAAHTVQKSKICLCIVLYCTVLYCTVLYCTVLYCTVLYCTFQQYFLFIQTLVEAMVPKLTTNVPTTWENVPLRMGSTHTLTHTYTDIPAHTYIARAQMHTDATHTMLLLSTTYPVAYLFTHYITCLLVLLHLLSCLQIFFAITKLIIQAHRIFYMLVHVWHSFTFINQVVEGLSNSYKG